MLTSVAASRLRPLAAQASPSRQGMLSWRHFATAAHPFVFPALQYGSDGGVVQDAPSRLQRALHLSRSEEMEGPFVLQGG